MTKNVNEWVCDGSVPERDAVVVAEVLLGEGQDPGLCILKYTVFGWWVPVDYPSLVYWGACPYEVIRWCYIY